MKIPVKGSVVRLTRSVRTTDENDFDIRIPKGTRCHVERVRVGPLTGLQFELTPEGYRTWFFMDQNEAKGGDFPFELVQESTPAQ